MIRCYSIGFDCVNWVQLKVQLKGIGDRGYQCLRRADSRATVSVSPEVSIVQKYGVRSMEKLLYSIFR